MFKLLLFLLFTLPILTKKQDENCTKAAAIVIKQVDLAYHNGDKVTRKTASEMTGVCQQLKECEGIFKNETIYMNYTGRMIKPFVFWTSICTALESMSGPLGECFDKIRGYNKTGLMAYSWASLGPNRQKEFEKLRVLIRSESCFSIMNPYSQSLINKYCTPKAAKEFGKVTPTLKKVSCMLMQFFSVSDFYDYLDKVLNKFILIRF